MVSDDLIGNFIRKVREIYGDGFIPLHRPLFDNKEKQMINHCIESNFVSSAGQEIEIFENEIAKITSSQYAISTVSGTAALHAVLHALGVGSEDEVLTQSLSFVATVNAVKYCNAQPIFIDVEIDNGTMCANLLRDFFNDQTTIRNGQCINKNTGKRIAACVVMHTFGHPSCISDISEICAENCVCLVEDSAEALGSLYNNQHVGQHSVASIYSFNGNKIITTGGGGCVTTNDADLAKKIKHITTTAKRPHAYEYYHDQIGFNYRMPNINACLGLAQLEKLDFFLEEKRSLAACYEGFFSELGIKFWKERAENKSNYWLNAISFNTEAEKLLFLEETNKNGVMTRPLWFPLYKLPAYVNCFTILDGTAEKLYNTTVSLPSSVPNLK